MKYLVVYAFEHGFGNAECEFGHNPPTISDIRDAEEKIQKLNKFTLIPKIINYMPLSN